MKSDWIDSLEYKIGREWTWRLQDLISYKQSINAADDGNIDVLCRVGVLLLYSHWEGFVKNSGKIFIKCFENEEIKNVPNNIIIAHFLSVHKKFFSTKTAYEYGINVLSKMKEDEKICINVDEVIKTDSNLNYKNLLNILLILGIDKSKFELKEKYINEFVLCRHSIAHGEKRIIKEDEIISYIDTFIYMLMEYKEDLLNIAESIYKNNTKMYTN